MSFQTPLSTLSAALGQVPIAPELMGTDGGSQPLDNTAEPTSPDLTTQVASNGNTYPDYASSSTRDPNANIDTSNGLNPEESTPWAYDQTGESSQIWESTYPPYAPSPTAPSAQQQDQQQQQAEDPSSLKRKRRQPNPNAKPRPPKRTIDTEDPMSNTDNLEYEHPSKDIRLGAVFVHPPAESSQACVRCHRIKRKCEGGKPRCQGCSKADVACVFELSGATSG
jgi:hypothetical protein